MAYIVQKKAARPLAAHLPRDNKHRPHCSKMFISMEENLTKVYK